MVGEVLTNTIIRSKLTVGLHACTTQAIKAFDVKTQPQATGREIPNEHKKGCCYVCKSK